jgi:hypothetical protein
MNSVCNVPVLLVSAYVKIVLPGILSGHPSGILAGGDLTESGKAVRVNGND